MSSLSFFEPTHLFTTALRRKPLRAVFAGESIKHIAMGLFAVFEPIYILVVLMEHHVAHPYAFVFLYYGILHVAFGFTAFLGARFVSSYGFRNLTLVSTPFLLGHVALLFLARQNPFFLIASLVVLLIRFTCFWPAYHVFFAQAAAGRRGEAVGNLAALTGLMSAISPAIGGLLIGSYGFPLVLALVMGLLVFSAVPYLAVELRDGHRGSPLRPLREEWNERGGPAAFLAFVGQAFEEGAAALVWPLLLFSLAISFEEVGVLTMVVSLLGLIVTALVGRYVDHRGRRLFFALGAPFVLVAWLLRAVTATVTAALLANTLIGLTRPFVGVPFTAAFYDHVSGTTQVAQMHAVLYREFATNVVGRGIMFLGGAAVLWQVGAPALRMLLLMAIPGTLAMSFVFRWIPHRTAAARA